MNPNGRRYLLDACGSHVPGNPNAPLTYSWTCDGSDEDCTKMIAMSSTSCGLIISPGMLHADEEYRFHVAVTNPATGEHPAKAQSLPYYVNAPPSSGYCRVLPQVGVAFETEFAIKCSEWTDVESHLPLKYDYFIRDAGSDGKTVLGESYPNRITDQKFGPGSAENNYTRHVLVTVSDKYGAAATTTAAVQVLPPPSAESDMNAEETLGGQLTAGNPEAVGGLAGGSRVSLPGE